MANWFMETFAPETVDRRNRQRALLQMGRGYAPTVQDQRIRGLLESDNPGDVQAGLGLLNENRLRSLVGTPSSAIPLIEDQTSIERAKTDDQPLMPRTQPGTGLLGGQLSLPQFYAGLAGLGGDFTKLGITGLTSLQPNASDSPAAVREWEYFRRLKPEEQQQFLGLKRQGWEVENIGNVPHLVSRIPGYPSIPLSTLGREASGQSTVEGAKGYGKKAGTDAAEVDVKQHESAIAASENISKIDTLLTHLKTSDAITGMGAELLKNIERAKVFLSDSEKAGRKVSDTELLDVMMGSEVFPLIGALGIGARGLDTPAEREFLRQVMSGSIPMNKQTLIRMTEIRRDVAKRAIDRFNKRVESGELDRYFEITGRPKQKITVNTQAQPKRIRVDAQGNVIP